MLPTTVKFIGSIPLHNQAVTWCWNNIGPQGEKWRIGFGPSYGYYLFHFNEESDATMFRLRWA